MNWFPTQVSDPADSEPRRSPRDVSVPGNEAILDAYSMAVINVVESVSPAVVNLTGRAAEAAKGSGSAMAQGIGFAVPSNTAQWVTTEILSYGRVRRRELGISAESIQVPRSLMRDADLLSNKVVIVHEVVPRSLAAEAGIEVDDMIFALNDRLVESVDDLHRLLSALPMTSPIELSLLRGQHHRTAVIN